jgi:hypothetical protein
VRRYLALALVLLGHSGVAQECPVPQPATPPVIHVTSEEYPSPLLNRALSALLADSLIDEGRGLVDVARERQIQKLMKQLKKESLMALMVHTRTTTLMTSNAFAQILLPEPTDSRRAIVKLKCREPLSDSCRLPSGVFVVTKARFDGCLHHR